MITKLQIYESIFGAIFTTIAQFLKHHAAGKDVFNKREVWVCLLSGILWIFHFLIRKELVYCAKQVLRDRKLNKLKKLKNLKKLKKVKKLKKLKKLKLKK